MYDSLIINFHKVCRNYPVYTGTWCLGFNAKLSWFSVLLLALHTNHSPTFPGLRAVIFFSVLQFCIWDDYRTFDSIFSRVLLYPMFTRTACRHWVAIGFIQSWQLVFDWILIAFGFCDRLDFIDLSMTRCGRIKYHLSITNPLITLVS